MSQIPSNCQPASQPEEEKSNERECECVRAQHEQYALSHSTNSRDQSIHLPAKSKTGKTAAQNSLDSLREESQNKTNVFGREEGRKARGGEPRLPPLPLAVERALQPEITLAALAASGPRGPRAHIRTHDQQLLRRQR